MIVHETFPRPPIEEAVIDIRVERSTAADLSVLQGFLDAVGPDYDQILRRMEFEAQVAFGTDAHAIGSASGAQTGWTLRAPSSGWVIMARVGGLAISKLRPYSRWDDLEARTRRIWTAYVDQTRPAQVVRVATRFINRIRLPPGPLAWDHWFTTGPRFGAGLPARVEALTLRAALGDADGCSAVLVIQEEPPDPIGRASVVIDIDAAWEGVLDPAGNELWDRLSALRDLKNRIFLGSITEATRELFR